MAVILVARPSLRTRMLGVGIAIAAGVLLGVGEYQRGRVHGRIETGLQLGASVATNLASAARSSLESLIRSNRLDGSDVSPGH